VILGIGIDLCGVARIRKSATGLGAAWARLLFTDEEQIQHQLHGDPVRQMAKAFCAKEAAAKALGKGLADGVSWHDIELLDADVIPQLRLSGGAAQTLEIMIPPGWRPLLHVTTSCDETLAQALVVISALPEGP